MYVGAPGYEDLMTFTDLDIEGKAPAYAGAPIGVGEFSKNTVPARESSERQFGPLTREQMPVYTTARPPAKHFREATAPEHLGLKPKATSRSKVQESFARQGLLMTGWGSFLYDDAKSPEVSPERQRPPGRELHSKAKDFLISAIRNTNPFRIRKPETGGPSPTFQTNTKDHENFKPVTGNGVEFHRLKSRLEDISREPVAQVRRVRIPIAQAFIKISSNVDAMDIDSPFIIPVSKLQLKNNGATSSTLQSIHRPISNGVSSRDSSVKQTAKQDFNERHRGRHNAIRAVFNKMDRPTGGYIVEDRLFRDLAEASMDEHADAFNKAYFELLGLARMAHTQ